MDDVEGAVESLKNLGLSEYESKVFIALQKLGRGTAREIYDLADVPRSQVYGAAESLEDRGLVEVSQSKPMEYRPVPIEEAMDKLENRYQLYRENAEKYLEEAQSNQEIEEEEREDIWTIRGSESIENRTIELIDQANDRILLGITDSRLLTDAIVDALMDKHSEGVEVVLLSEDQAIRDKSSEFVFDVVSPPENAERMDNGGRFLNVDSETVLLSVLSKNDPGRGVETAIWSSGTSFAMVLIQLTRGWLEEVMNV